MILLCCSIISSFLATTTFVLWLFEEPLPIDNGAGEKSENRTKYLKMRPWMGPFVDMTSRVGLKISGLKLRSIRESVSYRLVCAGQPVGFSVDEYLALTILLSTSFSILAGFMALLLVDSFVPGAVVGSLVGAAVPWFKLDELSKKRIRSICRRLPQVIDLMALTMKAGLDFPGALDRVLKWIDNKEPLHFELAHLLRKLNLGHSRASALFDFASRVPTKEVRQFAFAVIQSEKQGTPLAAVLEIQAKAMRTLRYQKAEQAAARAAVLIMGPLMLIFACVFVILLGPFLIKWFNGELF